MFVLIVCCTVVASVLTLLAIFWKVPPGLKEFVHFVEKQPNPVLQIVYLSLILGIFFLFLLTAFPRLDGFHQVGSWVAVMTTLAMFGWASLAPPTVITRANQDALGKVFVPDGLIFSKDVPAKVCSTCKVKKLARSKHCSVCNTCVHHFDHHCLWVNNCIAGANKLPFLLFLAATWLLCAYCVYLCSGLVYRLSLRKGLLVEPVHVFAFLRVFLSYGGVFLAMSVMTFLCGAAVFAFFVYHVYLALRGLTTNEFAKIRRFREAMETLLPKERVPINSSPYDRGLWGNFKMLIFGS